MSRITESARGEMCQIRMPGVCNHNPETTVFAHLNGAGMGRKSIMTDINGNPIDLGAYACSACHAFLDGGYAASGINRRQRDAIHAEATIRTIQIIIQSGLLIAQN